ncbi:MAG: PKD domain-containing protein, partial [Chloroflexota bacterium]
THTYGSPSPDGGYTVTLTATNDGGSSQPVTQQLTVNEALPAIPEASFTIGTNPATVNTGVTFTDTSTNTPTSWSWDFGDGNTSTEQNPTHTYGSPSPDGGYTVTLTATNDGGSSQPVTQQLTVEAEAVVSPQGPLLFVSNREGNLEIYITDANGQNASNVTNDASNDIDPVWSPDGTRIAFASNRLGDNDIFVLTISDLSVTQITTSGANDVQPSWSPDGTQLAFASDRNNLGVNNDVFVVNVADLNAVGGVTPLLTTPADEQQPYWSPDGSQIVFMSDAAGAGTNNLYIANVADPSTPVQLTVSGADNQPTWSSNGLIAFTSSRDGNNEIYTINPAIGVDSLVRLTSGANEASDDRLPEWSADGSVLYYTSNLATDGSGAIVDGNIWFMNADGTGQTPATTDASEEAQGDSR